MRWGLGDGCLWHWQSLRKDKGRWAVAISKERLLRGTPGIGRLSHRIVFSSGRLDL